LSEKIPVDKMSYSVPDVSSAVIEVPVDSSDKVAEVEIATPKIACQVELYLTETYVLRLCVGQVRATSIRRSEGCLKWCILEVYR
jgi:hypothetical protein